MELPAGADQRVRVFFTEGSCMTITPVAVQQAVTVQGSKLEEGPKQHTKVCGDKADFDKRHACVQPFTVEDAAHSIVQQASWSNKITRLYSHAASLS